MKVSILGVGAFGIALAKAFYANGNMISMWTKFKEEVETVLLKRENKRLLPGVKIPMNISISDDLESCMQESDIIVIATPMSTVREVSKEISKYLNKNQIICIVSKGIEPDTNKMMTDVVFEETASDNICMLSGPSFAIDIANGVETGFVCATHSKTVGETIKLSLESDTLVIDVTTDVVGTEMCSAVKNVFAILLGYIEGVGKSESTKASILTIAIRDMKKIVESFDGKSSTVLSYAGIGDLLLTCMSNKSRNYTLGKYIGSGLTLEKALEKMDVTTVEGLYTLDAILRITSKIGINVKSINLLYNIIYRNGRVENILECIK